MRIRHTWIFLAAFAMALAFSCVAQESEAPDILLQDDFSGEALDEALWVHTVESDFQTEVVEIADGRLRMAAATIGTDDETVKFHGVRAAEPLTGISGGVAISLDIDWNDQANGCYMTAGLYLCPTVAENPREEEDWLRLQYIGVPPGRNARCLVSVKTSDYERKLLTENWPEERTGREIGLQHIEMVLDQDVLVVSENGEVILETEGLELDFDEAYLYLQHSSHSNYPLREVFFDNLLIRR